MSTIVQSEIINLLSKAENIESVLQIPTYIEAVKDAIMTKMIQSVALECGVKLLFILDWIKVKFIMQLKQKSLWMGRLSRKYIWNIYLKKE